MLLASLCNFENLKIKSDIIRSWCVNGSFAIIQTLRCKESLDHIIGSVSSDQVTPIPLFWSVSGSPCANHKAAASDQPE